MKKILAFVLVLFLVPTISLSASEYTIDDCINYMEDIFDRDGSMMDDNDYNNSMMDEDFDYNDMPCHGSDE